MPKDKVKQLVECENKLIKLLHSKNKEALSQQATINAISNLLIDLVNLLKNHELPIPFVDFYIQSLELFHSLHKLRYGLDTQSEHSQATIKLMNKINDQLSDIIFTHPEIKNSNLTRPIILSELPEIINISAEQRNRLSSELQQQFNQAYATCEQIDEVAQQKTEAANQLLDQMKRRKFAADKENQQADNEQLAVKTTIDISVHNLASLLANDALAGLNQIIQQLSSTRNS